MRIAVDAMGSDRAPTVEVEGAVGALLQSPEITVVLVGDQAAVEAELARHPDAPRDRIELVHAPDVIDPGEAPTTAVRRKPNSSIVVGTRLVKGGEADAFLSAGSTGAVMAAATLMLRPIRGVDRPAVGSPVPSATGTFFLIDMGANVDTRPQHLLQFAHLGTIYAQDLMGVDEPRVGLLNIGTEPGKGNEQTLETYALLSESPTLNFVGNVEGREVIHDACDVLVCDGFVGNVLIKFYESFGRFMAEELKREMEQQQVRLDLRRLYQKLDYSTYGGAPLLGVNGVVVIAHGGSSPLAIRNGIGVAARSVERRMVEHIAKRLGNLADRGEER
ncbi:MAG TPA: phosphate acyltransferase PlsX [Longimicrobiaceae bacterium]|nr:phosphate acyltransferase PlsX [Longimicrobiaceae bacterium]